MKQIVVRTGKMSWGTPFYLYKGSSYEIDEGDKDFANSIPIGFAPATAATRWGEAVWTARDLTEGRDG